VGTQTFIEVNGKKYDAVTGKRINDGPTNPVVQQTKVQVGKTGVVDGIRRRKPHHVAKNAAKTLQKPKTLMRNSVNKPNKTKKAPTPRKRSVEHHNLGVSAKRAQHAQSVHKNTAIKKYAAVSADSTVVKKHAPLNVRKKPALKATKQKTVARPTDNKTVTHKRSKATSALIEAALAKSTSHEQPEHKVKKRKNRIIHKFGISTKAAGLSSAILAGVLLGGFFAINNVPNLSMKVAATRAGVDASIPGYRPSGFSFRGPIDYTTGRVTVSFKSNSDSRQYDLTEQNSNWNSEALLSNYIIAQSKQYQTFLDHGRTLFIYDGSNATWVDNGIWYQIEGQSSLTTDQLIRISSSL